MAGVVIAVGVGDADDRPVQRVVGISHRLDEGLAQEQRKPGVAITRQSLAQSVSHMNFLFVCPTTAAQSNLIVIPGRTRVCAGEPGIHNHDREYGFRACAASAAHPGMT